MLLSACMIVKDEEEMLKKTLPALSSSVDEIIVVDTGSTDQSVEIAKECGAKVYSFPWINDFSAARNESLKHAQGEWVIWIDADEKVKKEEFEKMKEFLKTAADDIYSLKIGECRPDQYELNSFYFRMKIFRNNRGIHFVRPFNEQVVDSTGRFIQGNLITSAMIYHWGGLREKEIMGKKRARNLNILEKIIKDRPDDLNYHFLLANNYYLLSRYEEAAAEYQKAIALDVKQQFAAWCYVRLGWCFYNSNKGREAYQAAMNALKINQDENAAYNILGGIALSLNHPEDAIQFLKRAEQIKEKTEVNGFTDISDCVYKANYFMGEAYLRLKDIEKAKSAFEKAYQAIKTDEALEKIEELKWA